jgi:hypothetical protein
LGFGKDGTVWVNNRANAVKAHARVATYIRERDVYVRLAEEGVTQLAGHTVPQLQVADDALGVIEMTMVRPPFVLDFATAQLDVPFDFPAEIMEEWLAERLELFGERWQAAAAVVRALERLGISMLDVHPGNIRTSNEPVE